MKKFLFAIMAFAAVTFASCGKEPNEPQPDQPGDNPDTTTVEDLAAGFYMSAASEQLQCEAVSENGVWAVGKNFDANVAALWNLSTNEVITFDGEGGALHAVTSRGVAVGDNNGFAVVVRDGKMTTLQGNANEAGSSAYGISEDGKVIVGFYFDEAWQTKACIWDANGNRTELPLPAAADVPFDFSGAEARWISADGSVIAGFLMDDFSTWPAVIWRKSGSSYVCDVICKDYFEANYQEGKPYMQFGTDAMALSKNGEWLTLVTQAEYDPDNWDVPAPVSKAARFNLKSKTLEVFEGVDYLFGIANDGTALGCTTDMMSGDRQGFVVKANENTPTPFLNVYTNEELTTLTSVTPSAINGKGNVVLGVGFGDDGMFSFVIVK